MSPSTAIASAIEAARSISLADSAYSPLSDDELLQLTREAARLQSLAATLTAVLAGEIARRSAPALGQAGLAQRRGHRTPHELVRVTMGSTAREASSAVRVGGLSTTHPWLGAVRDSLSSGELSPAAAEAIASGLGVPSAGVDTGQLSLAAAHLAAEAALLDADRLQRRARELRDDLDSSSIADREAERRTRRALTFRRRADGMSHLSWTMDPETAAAVGELYDRVTSPCLGGPRFVDLASAIAASHIADDERTTEQLASDTFLELLRHAADRDSSQLLGRGAPQVRVLVTAAAIAARGHGFIEGQSDPVSIETVERLVCSGTTIDVTLLSGQPLDVGRSERLFTARQRLALAVRDGGCRWPDCERPPSWTEAHHINHWARDHGSTDVAAGILLCRHHHLLAHNNGWEIRAGDRGEYWLVPPPAVDPSRTPRPMPTKSRVMRELERAS